MNGLKHYYNFIFLRLYFNITKILIQLLIACWVIGIKHVLV